jgi:hypothetical protein
VRSDFAQDSKSQEHPTAPATFEQWTPGIRGRQDTVRVHAKATVYVYSERSSLKFLITIGRYDHGATLFLQEHHSFESLAVLSTWPQMSLLTEEKLNFVDSIAPKSQATPSSKLQRRNRFPFSKMGEARDTQIRVNRANEEQN